MRVGGVVPWRETERGEVAKWKQGTEKEGREKRKRGEKEMGVEREVAEGDR